MHILVLIAVVVVVLVVVIVRDALRDHRGGRERLLQLRPLASRNGFRLRELDQEQAAAEENALLEGSRMHRRVRGHVDGSGLLLEGQLAGPTEGAAHATGYTFSLFDLPPAREGAGAGTTVIVARTGDGTTLPRFYLQPSSRAVPISAILDDALADRFSVIADVGDKALFGGEFRLEVDQGDLERLRCRLSTGPTRGLIEARRAEPLCVESTADRLIWCVEDAIEPAREVRARLREIADLLAGLKDTSAVLPDAAGAVDRG